MATDFCCPRCRTTHRLVDKPKPVYFVLKNKAPTAVFLPAAWRNQLWVVADAARR